MSNLRKCLQRAGLVSTLLIVGVLVGLLAPLPSGAESLPIVQIFEDNQGSATTLSVGASNSQTPNNCSQSAAPPASYRCYPITGVPGFPTTIAFANQRWRIGSTASDNRARVLVRDTSDGVPYDVIVSGIAITPNISIATPISVDVLTPVCNQSGQAPDCMIGKLTIKKTFDLTSGKAAGTFGWGSHAGGNFDSPGTPVCTPTCVENALHDELRISGTACFSSLNCNPSTGPAILPTGVSTALGAPNTKGSQLGISINSSASIVKNSAGQNVTCTDGGSPAKCRPTVLLTYQFSVRGYDTMNLTDSVTGCGGPCKVGFKGQGQTPACGDENTPPEGNEEPSLLFQCKEKLKGDSDKDGQSNIETGGVPGQVCGTTCIQILLEGTPPGTSAGAGPFVFSTSGGGDEFDCSLWDTPCQMTLNSEAIDSKLFSNTDPPAGDRCFKIEVYPPGGAQGNFQLDQVNFRSQLGSTGKVTYSGTGNSKTKTGACVTKLVEGDAFIFEVHVH